MLLSLYSFNCRFCFRHIQTYSSVLEEHTHAYSEPCVSLPYSEPWHILITNISKVYSKHHIKHFHKSSILDVWYSSECTSLLKMLDFTASSTLYFRLILACSRFIQPYLFFLRHINNPSILRNILLHRYSGTF